MLLGGSLVLLGAPGDFLGVRVCSWCSWYSWVQLGAQAAPHCDQTEGTMTHRASVGALGCSW